jgi:manganese/zinc/iron transport system permease protein
MIGFLEYNTVVVLAGACLLGLSAGIIGVFALLRRRALLGDAVAHAGLPGVCLAFILLGQRSMPVLLAGALVAGLASLGVLTVLRRWTRIKEDAALALVLSLFYAFGVLLLSILPLLSGSGSSGLDRFLAGSTAGIVLEDVYWLAGLALATAAAVVLLYKEMKLVAFDADFAQTQGWPVYALDYFLNLLVVLAVVIGLPAVGVVMMAALLIIPAAAARFWSDRLTPLVLIAGLFGLVGAATGALTTSRISRLATGPVIILACAALFLLSLLFGPRRGLVARWAAQRRFQLRLGRHQLLCRIHAWRQRRQTDRLAKGDLTQALGEARGYLRHAVADGLIERQGDEWLLTPAGQDAAALAARRQEMAQQYLHSHPELASSLTSWFLTEEASLPAEAGTLVAKHS